MREESRKAKVSDKSPTCKNMARVVCDVCSGAYTLQMYKGYFQYQHNTIKGQINRYENFGSGQWPAATPVLAKQ